ncbi:ABC transporter permease [Halalkalibacter sp. AB-rgal2]|uniref:ABC transporter permease n=1 Tax=Halalkalibacter sp. AB-rgal2 TaxID=3242695 RepID=UPI00359D7379
MFNITRITLYKNMKDAYLLFWSIFLPLAVLFGLNYFNIDVSMNTLLGVLSISIYFYCCITNSFSVYSQRKRGVFDLLKITPFSLWKYLSAITFSQTIIACSVSIVLLFVENSLFHFNMSALSIFLFIPLFWVGSAIFTLLGFALSSLPKNEGQLSITTNLIMLPLILCSSIFFNIAGAPKIVQWISWVNPFEWLQRGYRAALEMDLSFWALSILILFAMLSMFLFVAKVSFRNNEK